MQQSGVSVAGGGDKEWTYDNVCCPRGVLQLPNYCMRWIPQDKLDWVLKQLLTGSAGEGGYGDKW